MRFFSEILKEQYSKYNIDPNETFKLKYKWFGYTKGLVEQFDTEKEAREKYCLIERVLVNEEEHMDYLDKIDKIHEESHTIWYEELRNEWSHLDSEFFDLCYNYSYDKNHSSTDEIANGMYDIVAFAKRVYELGRLKNIVEW